eukprot:1184381-Pleurochrysis_carterae.AAC.1
MRAIIESENAAHNASNNKQQFTASRTAELDSQSRRSKLVRGPSRSWRPTVYGHARLSQACSVNFII